MEIDRLYLWTLGCFVKGMQTNVLANSVHGVFQYQRNLEVDKSSQKGLQKTGRSYITSIKNKFPNWINRNLVVGKTFMKRALDNEECAAKSFELTSIVFYFHVTVFPACNSNANEYCESIIMLWESIASLFTQRRVIFIITVQPSLVAILDNMVTFVITKVVIVTGTPRFCHVRPLLFQLHWFPISYCIKFKILLLTFKCLCGLAPNYLVVLQVT